MAIKDVKNYFYTMLSQYIEEKQNLADFDEALKEAGLDDIFDSEGLLINKGTWGKIKDVKNPELLNEQECQYAMNPATHLDFLIYNRIGKKPILAIEVDGYEYHKNGTEQSSRDVMKNHIMELYEIPLLRFKTNGSGEREKIVDVLDMLFG